MSSKSPSSERLVVRADAGPDIGSGHVMRCLALVQAFRDRQGEAAFVMRSGAPALEGEIGKENVRVVRLDAAPGSPEDARQTIAAADELGASWVVVDGYPFGADYQKRLQEAGRRVLFFDDYGHADRYSADLVLNQNITAEESIYRARDARTRLLLGPGFALLRRRFASWRNWTREIPAEARKVLVTLGGSPPEAALTLCARSLSAVDGPPLEVKIVAGTPAGAGHERILREAGARAAGWEILESTAEMDRLMAWADLAVSAGGSTCWELAFMGLPNVILCTVDHQLAIAEGLQKQGAAVSLGTWEGVTENALARRVRDLAAAREVRASMSGAGRRLVDGRGSERVLDAIREMSA